MNNSRASMVSKDKLQTFAPGISWAVLPGDGMTLVYWVFDPAQCGDVPLHNHEVAQGGVVLEGSIHLHDENGAKMTLHPGDMYTLQQNAPHGATFTERCVVLDIFSPNRVEYEKRYAEGITADTFVVV
jgi:quercetin dioxygenase-like cupin family protein